VSQWALGPGHTDQQRSMGAYSSEGQCITWVVWVDDVCDSVDSVERCDRGDSVKKSATI
jgi:hypothetical protein